MASGAAAWRTREPWGFGSGSFGLASGADGADFVFEVFGVGWARIARRDSMAKLALVYGMRLFPAEELNEVKEANVSLKNGKDARVTMHLIEGSKEEIEKTLRQSLDAFFEMYPEI
jgi:hypothetical protein